MGDKYHIFVPQTERIIVLGEKEYGLFREMMSDEVISIHDEQSQTFSETDREKLFRIFSDKGLVEAPKQKRIFNGPRLLIHKFQSNDLSFIRYREGEEKKFSYSVIAAFAVLVLLLVMECLLLKVDLLKIPSSNLPNILAIIILAGVSVLLHEFGHAITIKKNGGHVAQYDLGFLLFFPCVTTIHMRNRSTGSRISDIAVDAAGVTTNMLLACIALPLFYVSRMEAIRLFGQLNILMAISNLIIFFRTDGRHLLAEMVGAKNKELFTPVQIIALDVLIAAVMYMIERF